MLILGTHFLIYLLIATDLSKTQSEIGGFLKGFRNVLEQPLLVIASE